MEATAPTKHAHHHRWGARDWAVRLGLTSLGLMCWLCMHPGPAIAHGNKAKTRGTPITKSFALPLAAYEASASIGIDFALLNHHGKAMERGDFAGKVVLMTFGHIDCPDSCPRLLGLLAGVHSNLGKPKGLQLVFVTVAPSQDTPARLKAHLTKFGAGITGLTGTQAQIKRTTRAYQVGYRKRFTEASKRSNLGYLLDHSLVFYLLDTKGQTRYAFPYDASQGTIEAGVGRLLKEEG